jgi:hypothetical protein
MLNRHCYPEQGWHARPPVVESARAGISEEEVGMHRGLAVAACGIAFLSVVAASAAGARPNSRCRIVRKHVHGRTRKVRVCAKKKPAPPAKLVSTTPLDGAGDEIVEGFGSVWVRVTTSTAGGEVERIDPATQAVLARVPVGGYTGLGMTPGLAAGDGAVWAPNPDANTLSRIDPATNRVVATLALPNENAKAVTTTPGAVWVGMQGMERTAGAIARVDPATDKVVATIPLAGANGAEDLATTSSAVWVQSEAQIVRIDPQMNAIVATLGVPARYACGGIAADDSAVWVATSNCANNFPRANERIDAQTNAISQWTVAGTVSSDVGVGALGVWTTSGRSLARVNPATHKATGLVSVDSSGPNVVAVGASSIWVGTSSGQLEEFAPTG